jgi:prepilin-type N-terminal cleavage/methylation domain-containing protein
VIFCPRSESESDALPPRAAAAAGFTVLELLLVMAVIAVLSGLVLGVGRAMWEGSRSSRATAELTMLAATLESYHLAQGDYPHTEASAWLLQALIGRRGPAGEAITARPLIEVSRFKIGGERDPFVDDAAELLDPWGAAYHYAYKSTTPWTNPGYLLYSCGPDGMASHALLTGGFPDPTAAGNSDNLWAVPP